ncbi:uncharacterized protein LOC144130045 isoform X2 [Amblyomma americanum]
MPGIRFFRCPRCACHQFSLRTLFRHLRIAHGHETNWLCGLSGCMQTFRHFFSYKKHVHRKHASCMGETCSRGIVQVGMARSSTNAAPDLPTYHEEPLDVQAEEHDFSSSDYGYQLAKLLFKWKEGRRLPESTVHELANDIIDFVETIADHQQTEPLDGPAISIKEICKLQLDQLRTRSGRTTYWKTHFPFVESRTVVLCGNDTIEYIPLCEVLKCILEHSELSNEFSNDSRTDGYMCSVFDGSAFQNHEYFAGNTSKLCLQLYSDEFEVCNPLGSKRGKHKMTAVYFSVLNFDAKLRSALSGIHLVLLVKDKHIATYGFSKILEPLITDVKILANHGITVNRNLVKGSVFIFTGDNLSSHRIGGFKCTFSQGRICRYCMALRTETGYKHLEGDFVLCSPQGHKHHLSMLRVGLPMLSLYGVKEQSALLCPGFDPTQHLPPDIMHDLHEGVLPFALRHIISALIEERFFSLSDLNKSISEWLYDPHDICNKPEAIAKPYLQGKAVLKASATQVFCLFRYLTFFVGDNVPSDNAVWQLYLLLREIVDIIMSHKIPVSHIAYLQRKIHFFCFDFKVLFPSASLPCKVHYLIHYPSYIEKFGPLSLLWAMRFEAKHQYFKDIARKIRNWKNLSHSLAVRHQFLQSFLFAAGDDSIPRNIGVKSVLYEHLPGCVKEFITENNLESTNTLVVKSVIVDGRTYSAGCCLVRSVPEDSLPEFLLVCQLFYVNKVLMVMAKLLETVLMSTSMCMLSVP